MERGNPIIFWGAATLSVDLPFSVIQQADDHDQVEGPFAEATQTNEGMSSPPPGGSSVSNGIDEGASSTRAPSVDITQVDEEMDMSDSSANMTQHYAEGMSPPPGSPSVNINNIQNENEGTSPAPGSICEYHSN